MGVRSHQHYKAEPYGLRLHSAKTYRSPVLHDARDWQQLHSVARLYFQTTLEQGILTTIETCSSEHRAAEEHEVERC